MIAWDWLGRDWERTGTQEHRVSLRGTFLLGYLPGIEKLWCVFSPFHGQEVTGRAEALSHGFHAPFGIDEKQKEAPTTFLPPLGPKHFSSAARVLGMALLPPLSALCPSMAFWMEVPMSPETSRCLNQETSLQYGGTTQQHLLGSSFSFGELVGGCLLSDALGHHPRSPGHPTCAVLMDLRVPEDVAVDTPQEEWALLHCYQSNLYRNETFKNSSKLTPKDCETQNQWVSCSGTFSRRKKFR